MTVKYLFAAVHIKRWMAVAVQRAQSGDLFAPAVAGRLPTALLEKLQQRNPLLKRVLFGMIHGGACSRLRIRSAARKSQASRVGVQNKFHPRVAQILRLSSHLHVQRRMVAASGTRSASRHCGAARSIGWPSAREPIASWRAGRL